MGTVALVVAVFAAAVLLTHRPGSNVEPYTLCDQNTTTACNPETDREDEAPAP